MHENSCHVTDRCLLLSSRLGGRVPVLGEIMNGTQLVPTPGGYFKLVSISLVCALYV